MDSQISVGSIQIEDQWAFVRYEFPLGIDFIPERVCQSVGAELEDEGDWWLLVKFFNETSELQRNIYTLLDLMAEINRDGERRSLLGSLRTN